MLQFYQIPREKWFKKRLMHTVIVIQSSQLPAAYWTCISSFWFGGFAFIGVLQRAAKKNSDTGTIKKTLLWRPVGEMELALRMLPF